MHNHQIKINRADALSPALPMANKAIWGSISDVLIDELTSAQLAEVKKCLDAHWHKAQAEARRPEGDCYWIEGRLLPVAVVRAIEVQESVESIPARPTKQFPYSTERWTTRTYYLNYWERF